MSELVQKTQIMRKWGTVGEIGGEMGSKLFNFLYYYIVHDHKINKNNP